MKSKKTIAELTHEVVSGMPKSRTELQKVFIHKVLGGYFDENTIGAVGYKINDQKLGNVVNTEIAIIALRSLRFHINEAVSNKNQERDYNLAKDRAEEFVKSCEAYVKLYKSEALRIDVKAIRAEFDILFPQEKIKSNTEKVKLLKKGIDDVNLQIQSVQKLISLFAEQDKSIDSYRDQLNKIIKQVEEAQKITEDSQITNQIFTDLHKLPEQLDKMAHDLQKIAIEKEAAAKKAVEAAEKKRLEEEKKKANTKPQPIQQKTPAVVAKQVAKVVVPPKEQVVVEQQQPVVPAVVEEKQVVVEQKQPEVPVVVEQQPRVMQVIEPEHKEKPISKEEAEKFAAELAEWAEKERNKQEEIERKEREKQEKAEAERLKAEKEKEEMEKAKKLKAEMEEEINSLESKLQILTNSANRLSEKLGDPEIFSTYIQNAEALLEAYRDDRAEDKLEKFEGALSALNNQLQREDLKKRLDEIEVGAIEELKVELEDKKTELLEIVEAYLSIWENSDFESLAASVKAQTFEDNIDSLSQMLNAFDKMIEVVKAQVNQELQDIKNEILGIEKDLKGGSRLLDLQEPWVDITDTNELINKMEFYALALERAEYLIGLKNKEQVEWSEENNVRLDGMARERAADSIVIALGDIELLVIAEIRDDLQSQKEKMRKAFRMFDELDFDLAVDGSRIAFANSKTIVQLVNELKENVNLEPENGLERLLINRDKQTALVQEVISIANQVIQNKAKKLPVNSQEYDDVNIKNLDAALMYMQGLLEIKEELERKNIIVNPGEEHIKLPETYSKIDDYKNLETGLFNKRKKLENELRAKISSELKRLNLIKNSGGEEYKEAVRDRIRALQNINGSLGNHEIPADNKDITILEGIERDIERLGRLKDDFEALKPIERFEEPEIKEPEQPKPIPESINAFIKERKGNLKLLNERYERIKTNQSNLLYVDDKITKELEVIAKQIKRLEEFSSKQARDEFIKLFRENETQFQDVLLQMTKVAEAREDAIFVALNAINTPTSKIVITKSPEIEEEQEEVQQVIKQSSDTISEDMIRGFLNQKGTEKEVTQVDGAMSLADELKLAGIVFGDKGTQAVVEPLAVTSPAVPKQQTIPQELAVTNSPSVTQQTMSPKPVAPNSGMSKGGELLKAYNDANAKRRDAFKAIHTVITKNFYYNDGGDEVKGLHDLALYFIDPANVESFQTKYKSLDLDKKKEIALLMKNAAAINEATTTSEFNIDSINSLRNLDIVADGENLKLLGYQVTEKNRNGTDKHTQAANNKRLLEAEIIRKEAAISEAKKKVQLRSDIALIVSSYKERLGKINRDVDDETYKTNISAIELSLATLESIAKRSSSNEFKYEEELKKIETVKANIELRFSQLAAFKPVKRELLTTPRITIPVTDIQTIIAKPNNEAQTATRSKAAIEADKKAVAAALLNAEFEKIKQELIDGLAAPTDKDLIMRSKLDQLKNDIEQIKIQNDRIKLAQERAAMAMENMHKKAQKEVEEHFAKRDAELKAEEELAKKNKDAEQNAKVSANIAKLRSTKDATFALLEKLENMPMKSRLINFLKIENDEIDKLVRSNKYGSIEFGVSLQRLESQLQYIDKLIVGKFKQASKDVDAVLKKIQQAQSKEPEFPGVLKLKSDLGRELTEGLELPSVVSSKKNVNIPPILKNIELEVLKNEVNMLLSELMKISPESIEENHLLIAHKINGGVKDFISFAPDLIGMLRNKVEIIHKEQEEQKEQKELESAFLELYGRLGDGLGRMSSVMEKNAEYKEHFKQKFGDQVEKIGEMIEQLDNEKNTVEQKIVIATEAIAAIHNVTNAMNAESERLKNEKSKAYAAYAAGLQKERKDELASIGEMGVVKNAVELAAAKEKVAELEAQLETAKNSPDLTYQTKPSAQHVVEKVEPQKQNENIDWHVTLERLEKSLKNSEEHFAPDMDAIPEQTSTEVNEPIVQLPPTMPKAGVQIPAEPITTLALVVTSKPIVTTVNIANVLKNYLKSSLNITTETRELALAVINKPEVNFEEGQKLIESFYQADLKAACDELKKSIDKHNKAIIPALKSLGVNVDSIIKNTLKEYAKAKKAGVESEYKFLSDLNSALEIAAQELLNIGKADEVVDRSIVVSDKKQDDVLRRILVLIPEALRNILKPTDTTKKEAQLAIMPADEEMQYVVQNKQIIHPVAHIETTVSRDGITAEAAKDADKNAFAAEFLKDGNNNLDYGSENGDLDNSSMSSYSGDQQKSPKGQTYPEEHFDPSMFDIPNVSPEKPKEQTIYTDKELRSAILGNQLDDVKKILEANPELINSKYKEGFTPLHYAAQQSPEMVALLLSNVDDKMALLRAQNNIGNTPLHMAASRGEAGVVNEILELVGGGALELITMTTNEPRSKTPVMLAGSYPEVQKILNNKNKEYKYQLVKELLNEDQEIAEKAVLKLDRLTKIEDYEQVVSNEEGSSVLTAMVKDPKEFAKKLKESAKNPNNEAEINLENLLCNSSYTEIRALLEVDDVLAEREGRNNGIWQSCKDLFKTVGTFLATFFKTPLTEPEFGKAMGVLRERSAREPDKSFVESITHGSNNSLNK